MGGRHTHSVSALLLVFRQGHPPGLPPVEAPLQREPEEHVVPSAPPLPEDHVIGFPAASAHRPPHAGSYVSVT